MATKEEVNSIIERFYEGRLKSPMAKIDKSKVGISLVLRYLKEAGRAVSAGEISRYMNVSTARVAVILRTMNEKQLIIKQDDCADARKTLVSLSNKGEERINRARAELLELMTEVVNKVGIERIEEFLEISKQINAVISAKIEENSQSGVVND